jgi:hypothetical protein
MPNVNAPKEIERLRIGIHIRQATIETAKERERCEALERIRSGQVNLVPLNKTERQEVLERIHHWKATVGAAEERERCEALERIRSGQVNLDGCRDGPQN